MPATFENLLGGAKKLFRHTDGVTSVTPFSIMKCHSETGLIPCGKTGSVIAERARSLPGTVVANISETDIYAKL